MKNPPDHVTALWRRLDTPGHDSCRLSRRADGWDLHGNAVFLHERVPASLMYQIVCDAEWRTRECEVQGWIGTRTIHCNVSRVNGVWTQEGVTVGGLEDCIDIDLGFTPATNLLQVRRLDLADGDEADVPVAWLDADCTELKRLPQSYVKRNKNTYGYEAPSVGYSAELELNDVGFISLYPGLWEME